jgi:hypothetical protein
LLEEVDELIPQEPSVVRWYTLIGCLLGAGIAIIYQIMTVLEWPLNTGGKPIVSMPSFIPVGFEMMILTGAFSALLGLFIAAKLPSITPEPYYSGSSTSDFVLFIWHNPPDYAELEATLRETGAWEVRPYIPTPIIS